MRPMNYYGITKQLEEKMTLEKCKKSFVIRTSWLYNEKGNNFVNTIIDFSKSRDALNIVSDQVRTPTYTVDLVKKV